MRDLEAIAKYLSTESAQAAELVESRIRAEAKLVSQFPRCGREGQIRGTRERVIRKTSYILVYRINSGRIRILRLYHGARKWPSRFQ